MSAGLRIYLSYRRGDSSIVARVRNELRRKVDGLDLVRGIDGIPDGADFIAAITAELQRCDGVLALIGPSFIDERLASPSDFVRFELGAAHESGLPIIPVLVNGAVMPTADVLPSDLKWLAYLNAGLLRPGPEFEPDLARLIEQGLAYIAESKAAQEAHRRGEDGPESARRRATRADVRQTDGGLAVAEAVRLERDEPGTEARPPGPRARSRRRRESSLLEPRRVEEQGSGIAPHLQLHGPPSWAHTWGEDRYGLWAGVVVKPVDPESPFGAEPVEYRFRFLPGGTFTKGSPEGELGRVGDREPQREVAVDDVWMGVTPVTQALYAAVIGKTPSRFFSKRVPWLCADRPVEQVSWDDAQAFLQRLGASCPDLGPRLPAEAEWEYACRAGTAEATYVGGLDDADFASSVLDGVAWYGGNARRDFELDDGEDLEAVWKGIFDGAPSGAAGTHRIGRLLPNRWGLYDMLGNVWEWCSDVWSTEGGPTDLDPDGGTERVYRGGSWSNPARYCRAAYRSGSVPGLRYAYLGFRVSRGQAGGARAGGR